MLTLKVTVDDVKTVYGKTSGHEHPSADAIYYQPGYGGSVKNPEICVRDASKVEVVNIERVQ